MEQFTATNAAGKTYCKCKHCPKTLTGTNVTRLRDHLLNPRVYKFACSSAATECQVDCMQKAVDAHASRPAAGQSRFSKQQTLSEMGALQIPTVSGFAQADLDRQFNRAVISVTLSLSLTEG